MVSDNFKLINELKKKWDKGLTRPPFMMGPDAREKAEREAGDPRFPHLFTIITIYKSRLLKYTKFGKVRLQTFSEYWRALKDYKKIAAPELDKMRVWMIEEMKEKARALGWKVNTDIEIPAYKRKKKEKTIRVIKRKGKYSAKADLLDRIIAAYPSTKTEVQNLTRVNLLSDPKIGFGAKAPASAVAANWGKNIMFNFDLTTPESMEFMIQTALRHEIVHCLLQQRKIGKSPGVPYEEEMTENIAFYLAYEKYRAKILYSIPGITETKVCALLRAWIKYKEAGRTTPVARESASQEVLGKSWEELRGKKKEIPTPPVPTPTPTPPPPAPPPAPAPPPPPPAPPLPPPKGDLAGIYNQLKYYVGWARRYGEDFTGSPAQIAEINQAYTGGDGYVKRVLAEYGYIPPAPTPPAPAPAPAVQYAKLLPFGSFWKYIPEKGGWTASIPAAEIIKLYAGTLFFREVDQPEFDTWKIVAP